MPSRTVVSGNSKSAVLGRLAWFRYRLRQFLRFSEKAAQETGITPQQHQLLLGIAGFTGRGWATISELAEFLQERHNAVVGLVDRAERRGLISRMQSPVDRRFVRLRLTRRGERLLTKLSRAHQKQLGKLWARAVSAPRMRPRPLPTLRRV